MAAVESGIFSEDIAHSINLENKNSVKPSTTDEFINEIANQLKVKLVTYQTPLVFEKADQPLPSDHTDYLVY